MDGAVLMNTHVQINMTLEQNEKPLKQTKIMTIPRKMWPQ